MLENSDYISRQSTITSNLRITAGECMGLGYDALEILNITTHNLHKFSKATRYKIKAVYQVMDWNGLDSIYQEESDCYKNCKPGIRYEWRDLGRRR